MKTIIGLVAATLMLSLGAFAQRVSGGAHGGAGATHSVGGGHIPAHGPAPVGAHPRFPAGASLTLPGSAFWARRDVIS